MRFVNPLPFVQDIAVSKAFYRDILGLSITADRGDFVQFVDGFALHQGAALDRAIFGHAGPPASPYGRRNLVLYFEVIDLDAECKRLAPQVAMIHTVQTEPWGGRVFRFYDPARHMIELVKSIRALSDGNQCVRWFQIARQMLRNPVADCGFIPVQCRFENGLVLEDVFFDKGEFAVAGDQLLAKSMINFTMGLDQGF